MRLSFTVRAAVIGATLFSALFMFRSMVSSTQTIVDEGKPLLLRLHPMDPRALMQGDFMALAYDRDLMPDRDSEAEKVGLAIFSVDERSVGTLDRYGANESANEGELALRYVRNLSGEASYGGKRFFFQEGMAASFEDAEYGMFKVDASGKAVLVGLADENAKAIVGQVEQ